jgi:hypothetical protein
MAVAVFVAQRLPLKEKYISLHLALAKALLHKKNPSLVSANAG